MTELTIIIPVFNAAAFLEESLRRIRQWTEGRGGDVELIVVDDGSVDNTLAVARNFKGLANYRVIGLKGNMGKGFALREAMKQARGEYIGFTDADLPYGLEAFDQMLQLMKTSPNLYFLYGSRSHVLSRSKKGYGAVRSIGRFFFSNLIRLIAVPGVSDTQCGIKMFRKKLVEAVIKKSVIDRFAIDIELFAIAKANNFAYQDFPVELTHRKESSVRLVKDTILMLADALRIKIRMWFKKYGI